ncbi:MAG: hypothetical protein Q8R24_10550 [Legionellaceae bacterium]|nr:hypothetical protein [Legionellaceae bacterium]
MRNMVEFDPAQFNPEILEYARAIARGFGNAATDLIELTKHPIDNVIVPMSELAFDTTVILAIHSDPLDEFRELSGFIHAKPQIYYDACARFQVRLDALQTTANQFVDGTTTERIEMFTHAVSGILVPGFIAKSAMNIGLMAKNIRNFGSIREPVLFQDVRPKNLLHGDPVFVLRTVEELKSIKGEKDYIFVITEQNELLIAENTLKNSILRDGYADNFAHHHELAGFRRVYAAGQLRMVDGHVYPKGIRDASGHYLPTGPHLPKLVETTFIKHGLTEAAGQYSVTPLLRKSIFDPIIIKHDFSFSPGKELLLTSPIAMAEYVKAHGLGSQARDYTKQPVSELIAEKMAEVAVKGADSIPDVFDAAVEEKIEKNGTEADKLFLDDIRKIKAYKQQSAQNLDENATNEQRFDRIKTFIGGSYASGNVAGFVAELGFHDLSKGLLAMSGGAQAGAGFMIGMSTWTGVGMFFGGATMVVSALSSDKDDGLIVAFQIIYGELLNIKQSIWQARLEIFDVKKDLFHFRKDLFLYLMTELDQLNKRVTRGIEHIDQLRDQLNYNDYGIQEGVDVIIDSELDAILEKVAFYDHDRPLPTENEYKSIMIELYLQAKKAGKSYFNGISIYEKERDINNTKAAFSDIQTLASTREVYGYLAALYADLGWGNDKKAIFDVRRWVKVVAEMERIAALKLFPEFTRDLIGKVLAQGAAYLTAIESIRARMPELLCDTYLADALDAMKEVETVNSYSEQLTRLVSGELDQQKKPTHFDIIGERPQFQDDEEMKRQGVPWQTYKVLRNPLKATPWIYPDSDDMRSCFSIDAFRALDALDLGRFEIQPFNRFHYYNVFGHNERVASDNEYCAITGCPHVKFVFSDDTVAVLHRIKEAGPARFTAHRFHVNGGLILDHSECTTEEGNAHDYVPKATQILETLRLDALREKKKIVMAHSDTWNKKLFYNLYKAREVFKAMGSPIKNEIPVFYLDEEAWERSFDEELRAKGYRVALPGPGLTKLMSPFSTFVAELQAFNQSICANQKPIYDKAVAQVVHQVMRLESCVKEIDSRPPAVQPNVQGYTAPPGFVHIPEQQLQSMQHQIQELTDLVTTLTEQQSAQSNAFQQMMRMIQTFTEKNQPNTAPIPQASSIHVEASTLAKHSLWSCQSHASWPTIALCQDPEQSDRFRLTHRLPIKQHWNETSGFAPDCRRMPAGVYCQGDEAEYYEFIMPKETQPMPSSMAVMAHASATGFISAIIPETVSDVIRLYFNASPRSADQIKRFVHLAFIAMMLCWTESWLRAGLGVAITEIGTDALKRCGIKTSMARNTAAAFGFFATKPPEFFTRVGLLAILAQWLGAQCGIWIEKSIVRKFECEPNFMNTAYPSPEGLTILRAGTNLK